MREIALSSHRRSKHTGKYVALVDDCDYEILNDIPWSALIVGAGRDRPLVYALGTVGCDGKRRLMHREVWKLMCVGVLPSSQEIDHKDHGEHGGLDNRRSNLRLATRLQQLGNSRKKLRTSSQYRGVYWHARASKWAAQISVGNWPKYLGIFERQEDAGRAYDAAAREHFGDFARLNFPGGAA